MNGGGVVGHRLADVLDVVVVTQLHATTRRVVGARDLLVDGSEQLVLVFGESHVLFILLILVVIWPHDAAH